MTKDPTVPAKCDCFSTKCHTHSMDLRKIFAFCRGQIVIFVFVFIYILASVVVFFFFELAPRDFSPPRGRWDLAFIGRFVVCFPRRSGHQSLASGPPCGAAPFRARPYPPRLSQSPGVLSREFLPNFLPAGKDFTKLARHFLPVGNPRLQVSDFRVTDGTLTQAGGA